MSNLDEFEINGEGGEPQTPPAPPSPEPPSRAVWPLVAVVVVLLAAVAAYFLWFREISESRPTAADTAPQAQAAAPEPTTDGPRIEPVELPPLTDSDPLVRQLIGAVVDHPRLATWLAPDGLVRRLAAAVDNVAHGVSPRPHLRSLAADGAFEVRRAGDELVVAPSTWERYDALVSAFLDADPDDIVTAYHTLEPLFDEAYRDLGYPRSSFETTLRQALRLLVDTPVPEGPVEVEERTESYHFADPKLEALSPAQKHLLRLGPENARQVQAQMRRVLERL